MRDENSGPEADVSEQRRAADDAPAEPLEVLVTEIGERPEADVLEQAEVVEERQVMGHADRAPDAPEADWLEQQVAEADEDERR